MDKPFNAFRAIRERLGLTQAGIAEGIGVTQGNVWHYENRDQSVPPKVARRLIEFASSLGHELAFDEIYASEPKPHALIEQSAPAKEEAA